MYHDLRNTDHEASTEGGREPLALQSDSSPRQGFWSSLADVLLSMPAGVGIRIGG
ncbi:hypothetical protein [Microbacterium sp. CPCC 204701]|uniref:hypothetical protein n=1 Tax=Microbacterium sp. CPCC 204701 TaxID=2493084 RepID=UPI0013E3DC4C|nr:hypothetical protein [Microbacterium sp. CPCC 204701]